MNVTGPYWREVSINWHNVSVHSDNTPLPEPMLAQMYVTMGHNELINAQNDNDVFNEHEDFNQYDPYV